MKQPRKHTALLFIALGIIALLLLVIDMATGDTYIPVSKVWAVLTGGECDEMTRNILLSIRFIRVIVAALIGVALSVSGLQMQTVFRNPLAGPSVLGISSGASMGVAFVVLLSGSLGGVALSSLGLIGELALTVAAIAGALSIMALIAFASQKVKGNVTLLIIGVMIGYVDWSIEVFQRRRRYSRVCHLGIRKLFPYFR